MSGLAVILAAFHLAHYKKNKTQEFLITMMIPMLMVFLLYTGSRSGFWCEHLYHVMADHLISTSLQMMILSAVGTVFFVELIDLIGPTAKIDILDGRSLAKTFTVSTYL